VGHLPAELVGRRQVVGRVGHGFIFRWWTNPILVCAGGYFLGFLPSMRSSPGRTSTGQRPSVGVEHVGKHPERVSGVPTSGSLGERLAPT
jgi:hypothetical protein